MSDRHWQGCPLVNPLCPSDYCDLPLDEHVAEDFHRLTTMIESGEVSDLMYIPSPWPKSVDEIRQLGWAAAQVYEADGTFD